MDLLPEYLKQAPTGGTMTETPPMFMQPGATAPATPATDPMGAESLRKQLIMQALMQQQGGQQQPTANPLQPPSPMAIAPGGMSRFSGGAQAPTGMPMGMPQFAARRYLGQG